MARLRIVPDEQISAAGIQAKIPCHMDQEDLDVIYRMSTTFFSVDFHLHVMYNMLTACLHGFLP